MAVREIELLLIADQPAKDKDGSGKKIRVVQWVFDRGASVCLEKRGYFIENGKTRSGKAAGFTYKDLQTIHPFWSEIVGLMKKPPPIPPAKAAAAPAAADDVEEVPF